MVDSGGVGRGDSGNVISPVSLCSIFNCSSGNVAFFASSFCLSHQFKWYPGKVYDPASVGIMTCFTVTVAMTGQEALVNFVPEKYDLALLDIQLPDMTGFDVANYPLPSAPLR